MPFYHITTNAKDTMVSAIIAIHQAALAGLDHFGTIGYQANIQQDHSEGQAGKAQEVSQMSAFQVEAIAFQVTKGFFNPHSQRIGFFDRLRMPSQKQVPLEENVDRCLSQLSFSWDGGRFP